MTDRTLADYMRESATDPFLLAGPQAPYGGWVYRDFRAMPQALWLTLLDLLGDGIEIVSANSRQLPPAPRCRAQVWLSPEAQAAWDAYLRQHA
jgi:hypothetical protein